MYSKKIEPFEKKLWLSSPTMHGEELKYVTEAYKTNWMSTVGENINQTEEEIASIVGCKYAVALSAGTAALHLAMKLAGEHFYGKPYAGVGAVQGHKVFCSDMTFDATINPVAYENGKAVFIDTERDTWNMGTTGLRVRKMLITAGYYSTATSREVQKMHEVGATYEKIMKALGISRASVNGYLPFNKGVYKLAEPTIYSEQSTRYRNRKSAIARLRESIGTEDELDCLWNAVIAFENYPFHTIGRNGEERIKFSYCVCRNKAGHMRNEIKISTKEKTVARATVEYGYKKAIEVQQKEGYVGGSKLISTPGASSYLYPIFIRLGIITTQKAVQA